MPCNDSRNSGGFDDDTYRRLQKATRAACDIVQSIRATSSVAALDNVSAETRQWIRDHDEMDRRRLELESERKQRLIDREEALRKLTPEERRALGLKDA